MGDDAAVEICLVVPNEEKRRLAVGRNLACVEKEATLIIENC